MTLNDREQVLRRTKLHWGMFILPALAILFAVLPVVVVSLGMQFIFRTALGQNSPNFLFWLFPLALLPSVAALAVTYLSFSRSEIILTTERLLWETGFLFRASGEIPLRNVETLFKIEPLLGRLFGYGTVRVNGTGGTRFPLAYLPDPEGFHSQLQAAVRSLQDMPKSIPSQRPPSTDDSRYLPKF